MTYSGSRNPWFVSLQQGGWLEEKYHRLLAAWAADCAEHVAQYYCSLYPEDDRVTKAINGARAWSRGEITMQQARELASGANAAAREASGAARDAAHAAGHAAAIAHMADHELCAAAYAIRSVRAASTSELRDKVGQAECLWQRSQLREDIRELVIADEHVRNRKFWSLFTC